MSPPLAPHNAAAPKKSPSPAPFVIETLPAADEATAPPVAPMNAQYLDAWDYYAALRSGQPLTDGIEFAHIPATACHPDNPVYKDFCGRRVCRRYFWLMFHFTVTWHFYFALFAIVHTICSLTYALYLTVNYNLHDDTTGMVLYVHIVGTMFMTWGLFVFVPSAWLRPSVAGRRVPGCWRYQQVAALYLVAVWAGACVACFNGRDPKKIPADESWVLCFYLLYYAVAFVIFYAGYLKAAFLVDVHVAMFDEGNYLLFRQQQAMMDARKLVQPNRRGKQAVQIICSCEQPPVAMGHKEVVVCVNCAIF